MNYVHSISSILFISHGGLIAEDPINSGHPNGLCVSSTLEIDKLYILCSMGYRDLASDPSACLFGGQKNDHFGPFCPGGSVLTERGVPCTTNALPKAP